MQVYEKGEANMPKVKINKPAGSVTGWSLGGKTYIADQEYDVTAEVAERMERKGITGEANKRLEPESAKAPESTTVGVTFKPAPPSESKTAPENSDGEPADRQPKRGRNAVSVG